MRIGSNKILWANYSDMCVNDNLDPQTVMEMLTTSLDTKINNVIDNHGRLRLQPRVYIYVDTNGNRRVRVYTPHEIRQSNNIIKHNLN